MSATAFRGPIETPDRPVGATGLPPREGLVTLAVAAAALGLFTTTWSAWPTKGVSAVGAECVLWGGVPYRDFWTMYAPGQFYAVAVLFKVFGQHLLVEEVAGGVVSAAAAAACYRLGLTLFGCRASALLLAAVYAVAMFHTSFYKTVGSFPTSLVLVLIALTAVVTYFQTGQRGRLFTAGLATGAAIVFKHDTAGYAGIAVVVGLAVRSGFGPGDRANRVRRFLADAGLYALATALVAGPALAYFVAMAGPDLWQDLIVFPLTDFPFSRPEAYPSVLPLGLYDPSLLKFANNLCRYVSLTVAFFGFLAGLGGIALAAHRGRPAVAAAGAMLATAYLLHYSAAHVQINTHVVTLNVLGLALGLTLWHQTGATWLRRVGLLLLAGLAVALIARPGYVLANHLRSASARLDLPKVSGFYLPPDQARAVAGVKACVDSLLPTGAAVYVGLHRHDVVIVGDTLLYFVLDRPSATRYPELHPAITDTAAVQREMIADLTANNVGAVVLKNVFPDDRLDEVKAAFQRNLPQVGATVLDDYLRANFEKVERFGPYVVWRRKGT